MIPPPGVVAVAAVVVVTTTATIVVVGDRGLLGECGEHRKAAVAKRALHASARPNQGCKDGDWLDA